MVTLIKVMRQRLLPVGHLCLAMSCLYSTVHATSLNIKGGPLELCSDDPMTGWYRDGYCKTDDNDHGVHTVCAEMTEEFLQYTKAKGNDLSTARGGFPGLKPGDNWCLCAVRWAEARDAGVAPKVKAESTNMASAKIAGLESLLAHAVCATTCDARDKPPVNNNSENM